MRVGLGEHPHLSLESIGMTGRAISDPWGELEYGQCYLVDDGRLLIGKFAVWRDPMMSAQDAQVAHHALREPSKGQGRKQREPFLG